MSKIQFYKGASKGKLQSVDGSVESLHSRRVLVIEDGKSSIFWIIVGTSASASTVKNTSKQIELLKSKSYPNYEIKNIDFDDAEERIEQILNQRSGGVSIPQIPGGDISSALTRKEEPEGPIIREFQISYYEEDAETADHLSKELESLLTKYMDEVKHVSKRKISKSKAKSLLVSISNEIINSIYQ